MSKLREKIKQFRIIILILVVVIAVLAFFLLRMQGQRQQLPTEAIERVEIRDVERIVSVDGYLTGVAEREVFFPAQSKVIKINKSAGQRVIKNEVIALLEVDTGFTTEEKEIKSPIKGIITEINFDKDDLVSNPAATAIKIVNNSTYRIELEVNENDITEIKTGQTATLVFPAISFEQEYAAYVEFVAPASVSTAGAVNYLVRITPKGVPDKAKLGMSVNIDILTARVEDVIAIPESYVIEREDAFFVKVLEYQNEEKTQYKLSEVEVALGLETDRFVEITSGLQEGQEIVEPSFTASRGFFLFSGN